MLSIISAKNRTSAHIQPITFFFLIPSSTCFLYSVPRVQAHLRDPATRRRDRPLYHFKDAYPQQRGNDTDVCRCRERPEAQGIRTDYTQTAINTQQYMNNITFEQLPQAVSMLIEKVGLLTDKVEKVLGMTPQQHGECRTLLTLNEVAALLGKSASTIYAMTSDKRIPYHKRGNKLYFFQNEIIAWIEQGGTSGVASENEIERRLEELRNGKKRKPGALTDGNSRMSAVAP